MKPEEQLPLIEEKHRDDAVPRHGASERRSPLTQRRTIQHFIPAVLLFSAVFLLFRSVSTCHGQRAGLHEVEEGIQVKRVALEAHIMSKCPDARDCLQQLVVPTMERVSDKVDFKLSYIGR